MCDMLPPNIDLVLEGMAAGDAWMFPWVRTSRYSFGAGQAVTEHPPLPHSVAVSCLGSMGSPADAGTATGESPAW